MSAPFNPARLRIDRACLIQHPKPFDNSYSTNPLCGLMSRPQWVVWRPDQRPGEPKPRKMPYDAKTLKTASTTDATTWVDFGTAQTICAIDPQYRLGFVFTSNDPYIFIDLDGCRNPETGDWNDEALQICAQFPGAAMEVSQSGTGAHIVASVTDKAAFANKRKRWAGWVECYTEGRFMALANAPETWQGRADTDVTDAALAWVPDAHEAALQQSVQGDRDPRWCGPEDDTVLLRRMLEFDVNDSQLAALDKTLVGNPNDLNASIQRQKAESKIVRRMAINALWTGDDAKLTEQYPSESGSGFDHSAADLALMNELAFWTGNDAERMLRLFNQSQLSNRDKWVKRKDYQQFTVRRSLASTREVYRGNRIEQRDKVKHDNEAIAADSEYKINTDILNLEQMVNRFYFIASGSGGGGVADTKSGQAVSIAIARNEFAASIETITAVDGRSGKDKIKQVSALELWLRDLRRKRADRLTWAAGAEPICDVPGHAGAVGFNTWRGILGVRYLDQMRQDRPMRESWLSAWDEHLAYLFPIESERQLFEQWCAHILQRPDELPQTGWCLIATQTGIGRNWLGSVLHRVIRGHVLGNVVLDGLLTGNFNGLMSRKLLIVVDEARAGMRGSAGWQNAEKLKTLVNPEFRSIDEKHGLQTVESNHMRWLTFSNNWDALPIEINDRRWNFVENPNEFRSHEYYRWIYDTLRRPEFVAAVRAHLEARDLTGFHHGSRSVSNAARDRVLRELASDLDLHLMEFKETWPGPVARGADLASFIDRKMAGGNTGRKVLYRAAARAGMIVTERMGRDMTVFVIVDSATTEANVAMNPAQWLSVAVDAATRFSIGTVQAGQMPGAMPPR